MKKKNTVLVLISIVTLFSFVAFATYAFFNVGNLNVSNVANFVAISEQNNMVFDTIGGEMLLNVTRANMSQASSGSIAAQNTTTLTINFQANTSYNMVCSYDIIYEWTSNDKYQVHTSGVTDNEFTVQAALASNSHVNEGINNIKSESDLTAAVGQNNSAVVVSGAQIDGMGTTINTAVWTLSSKFHNVDANQIALSDKSYTGRFKVDNVSCIGGTVSSQETLAAYLVNTASKSGTSTVGNSPWILTTDHPGEWRYAGKNPDNYVQFNSELWRIIGVMPNMTYCTGTFSDNSCTDTKTGTLVKIVRNSTDGTSAWHTSTANNWYNASLKSTLQSKTYASDSHVVTAYWHIYGMDANSGTAYSSLPNGAVDKLYNRERNINNTGGLYQSNPGFWYGKVGLAYPSDYGYSTTGSSSGTYSRIGCQNTTLYNWNSGAYLSDCANNGWLRYANVTSSAPSSGSSQWLITPASERADYAFLINSNGRLTRGTLTTSTYTVRPVVYLSPETIVTTGNGKWNSPYQIS